MNNDDRKIETINEKPKESKTNRRLIYVDASGLENNSIFKISLYDKEKNATHVLQLKDVVHNNEAEQYAIFYAILYCKKHDHQRCHILCDNQSAVNSKTVQFLSKDYNIGVSWIPREANIVADKISKLEPTLKEKEWNLLKLFVDLIKKQCHNAKDTQEAKDQEIISLKNQIEQQKKTIETRNTKISNQTQQIKNLQEKSK